MSARLNGTSSTSIVHGSTATTSAHKIHLRYEEITAVAAITILYTFEVLSTSHSKISCKTAWL